MLNNDQQREKTMKDFLIAMDIDTDGINVSSTNGLYSFNFTKKNQGEQFASRLNTLLQSEDVKIPFSTINLAAVIDNEIAQATCEDSKKLEIHRASCRGLLDIIKMSEADFNFNPKSGELKINLPNPVYASFLNLLEYPNLKFSEDGQLVLNCNEYLEQIQEGVVLFEGLNPAQLPLVFLKSSALEANRIFYATKALESGAVEVTPYFFVPETTVAPEYLFALDVSGSMDEHDSLAKLKVGVKKLSALLFEFQPDAKLKIITFSNGVHSLGEFNKDKLLELCKAIDALKTLGNTPLYDVTAQLIEKIMASTNHNNILLFTDGEDYGSVHHSAKSIEDLLESVDSDQIKASNKFNLFNYNTKLNPVMEKVAATFASDVVKVNSPDFMKALKGEPAVLQRWAAARGLFYERHVIEDAVEGKSETTYFKAFNMSAQMEALQTRVCQPGAKLSIFITDSSGKAVVDSTKKIEAPTHPLSYSSLISTLGINAKSSAQEKSTEKELMEKEAVNTITFS